MNTKQVILTQTVLLSLVMPAFADGKTKAAQEAAEFAIRKFGREAAKDGASVLARRIEQAALTHGDEVFRAVRLAGPSSLHLIEEAGAHSKQVARLLATHGEHGAVFVASKPRAMQMVVRHGEEAAAALVKSRGLALPAIESLGTPAARAFKAIGSPQNARRLAMMSAEGGELAKIGRSTELLSVIEKYGDAAMSFIWRHKGALAVSATLTAFLAEPEPFINGAKELAQTVAKPIAEVPAIMAKEGTVEVARNTNWTLVFLTAIAVLTALAANSWRRLGRWQWRGKDQQAC